MTDVEKFEYKSERKPINNMINDLGTSMKNGLKCDSSCFNVTYDIVNPTAILHFLWKFNWDELKKRGIDRLSGHIIVQLYNKTFNCKIREDLKVDVDLEGPNQIISKFFKANVLINDHLSIFEYSLVPHYILIEKAEEESIFMLTPSEQNDAILVVDGNKIHINKTFLSCHSKHFHTLFSSNHQEGQMNEIAIEGITYNDFKLLLGAISPNTVFPTDETVEKLLELAHRYVLPSVIRQVEHHLLQISKLGNEKKMLMAEKFGMSDLLEKSILEIDTMEKAKKWKESPEYSKLSGDTKSRVFQKFF